MLLISLGFYQLSDFKNFFINPPDIRGPGYLDSIQYWSAFKVWSQGYNPYDPTILSSVQFEFNQHSRSPITEPIMMWLPPSFLVFFGPLLNIQSYQTFSRLWLFSSLCAWAISLYLLVRKLDPFLWRNKSFIILCTTFPPFLNCLYFGQIGSFLLLGLTLLLLGFVRSSRPSQVIGLVLLSFKPHLLLPLFTGLVLIWLRQKEWKIPTSLLLIKISLLLISIRITDFHLLSDWIEKVSGSQKVIGASSTMEWMGTTLTTPVKFMMEYLWPEGAIAVSSLVPILGILLVPSILNRFKPVSALSVLVLISIPTSRYGWLYDYTLLFAPLVILLSEQEARSAILRNLVIASTIMSMSVCFLFTYQHESLPVILLFSFVMYCGFLKSGRIKLYPRKTVGVNVG